ncbi:MAG: hypothetical protein ACOYNP_09270 [Gemmataceae bacterium]|jgi:hypothetical protein
MPSEQVCNQEGKQPMLVADNMEQQQCTLVEHKLEAGNNLLQAAHKRFAPADAAEDRSFSRSICGMLLGNRTLTLLSQQLVTGKRTDAP